MHAVAMAAVGVVYPCAEIYQLLVGGSVTSRFLHAGISWNLQQGVMAHVYYPSIWEAEARLRAFRPIWATQQEPACPQIQGQRIIV